MNPITYTATCSAHPLAMECGRKNATLGVTATTAPGYFSVTAYLYSPGHRNHPFAGGCLHDEVLRFFPKLAPVVELHLCDVETGAPMHAESNGLYWLAGACPPHHLGQRYHGGNGTNNSPGKAWEVFKKHLRISEDEARAIRDAVLAAWGSVPVVPHCAPYPLNMEEHRAATKATDDTNTDARRSAALATLTAAVDRLRPRWAEEARAARELLATLAA